MKFVKTCDACPEQYDVLNKEGDRIAYIRLRYGVFTVECPDCGDNSVYTAYPKGDGCFLDDERKYHMKEAKKAIINFYKMDEDKTNELIWMLLAWLEDEHSGLQKEALEEIKILYPEKYNELLVVQDEG